MILGIGTDIIKLDRIKDVLSRQGDRFAQRILTPQELESFHAHYNQVAFLGKRFAAKEAVSKALKTGIGAISWQDIGIYNSTTGAPGVELYGRAHNVIIEQGGQHISLSLSDERDYALAFVVISS